MLNPTSHSRYEENDDVSTTRKVGESQPGNRSPNRPILNFLQYPERGQSTPVEVALTTRHASSTEIAAALTAPPRVVKPNHTKRFDHDGKAISTEAALKNPRFEPGVARSAAAGTRRSPRPLGLVPGLTRPLRESLRTPEKVSLMGVRIDCITERQVIRCVISSIREGRGGWIVTPNVDHLRVISERPDLQALLSNANLMLADGMPLIWASRLRGTPLPERVPGAGLILSLTAAAARAGASIFLLGGNPGDGEAAAGVLKRLNKGLKVGGVLCPPLGFENDPLQMTEIGNALHSAKPDIVYSCFGFPKEQLVISALRHRLPSAWFLGLGGSLAIVSGRTRRAPRWMQGMGMEWLWRLALEPRRLFERYIVNDLPFAIRLLATSLVEPVTFTYPERLSHRRS
jgi:N-acetylglucosaminyldiphosphoundecaprenol N-acetyl-beta-D-mannosaminyltransferase